jgi:hypothetical protein
MEPSASYRLWRGFEPVGIIFVFALLLGAFASAGLIAERATRGDPRLGVALVLGGLAFTLLSVRAVRPVARRRVGAFLVAQFVGALLGVGATHLVLALSPPPTGFSETPVQLVNDAVLVLGLSALVGSLVLRAPRARSLLASFAFALVALYHATAPEWHVDAFAFGELTIQRFVAIQVLAVAAGLMAFDWIASDGAR